MSGLAQSALHRQDRLWPAVLVSVLVHLALVVLAVFGPRKPPIDLSQKPIVARLVRLGEERPREYLPRKEAPPPAAEEAPGPPAPAPAPAAPTSKSAPAAPRPPAPKAAAGQQKPGGGRRLASVLSELRQEVQAGSAEGDPLGDASEAEGDQYLALVVRALRQNYRLPATISEKERLYLKGALVLFIESDGRISRHEFEKRSGNAAFDDALERAIQQTRLPPPPPQVRDLYRRTGLQVLFQI